MSREYRHAKRPARVRPVTQLETPAVRATSPTPHVAPVAGTARAVPRRAAREASDPLGGSAAEPDVVNALRRRRGAGSPLPDDVAQDFGAQLGTDLSGVRVHTDSEADRISRSVGAHAFTHGADVYFTSGAYDTSGSGQRVLAHELAHVAQNAAGKFRGTGGTEIGRADDPAEKDADHKAGEVLSALRRSPNASQTLGDGAEVDTSAAVAIRRLSVAQLKKLHEDAIAAIAMSAARDKRGGGGPAPARNAGAAEAAPAAAGGSHYGSGYTAEPDAEPECRSRMRLRLLRVGRITGPVMPRSRMRSRVRSRPRGVGRTTRRTPRSRMRSPMRSRPRGVRRTMRRTRRSRMQNRLLRVGRITGPVMPRSRVRSRMRLRLLRVGRITGPVMPRSLMRSRMRDPPPRWRRWRWPPRRGRAAVEADRRRRAG